MAADDKDANKDSPTTEKEQPDTVNPSALQKQTQGIDLTPPPPADIPDEEVPDEVQKAHEELIAAEIAAGKAQASANEKVDKAREKLADARATAVGAGKESEWPGYWHKTWAGHDVLQCGYCSWDVITSSLFNYQERMKEHLAAAHPNWEQLVIVYDNTGTFIEGGVQ